MASNIRNVMAFFFGMLLDCQQYLGRIEIVQVMIASIGIAAVLASLLPKVNKGIVYMFSAMQICVHMGKFILCFEEVI